MLKSITKITFLICFLVPFIGNSQCHYTIDMQDSYGDGWNGASVDVNINGSLATSFTFANGNAATDSITTMNGDIVDFAFNSGNWDTEITFQVYDPTGIEILNIGPFANNDGNDSFLLSDTSNATCIPQNVNVTFRVDMSKVTSGFVTPEINGTWNSFCGNCDPMSDPDGDNIWEKTISLYTGIYEFVYSADNLTIQETIDPSASCGNGSLFLPRRFLNVGGQDIVMPVVCWESCDQCNGFPQPPVGINCNTGNAGIIFSDDFESQGGWTGDYGTGNGIWQINSGGTASGGTGPDGAHSGASYFYFEHSTWGGGGPSQFDTATIVSPAIDLTSSNDDAELTFWMHGRGDEMGTLKVGISNSQTGPFNTVYTQFGETHDNANDPWSQIGINIGNYVGQMVYVSFTYERISQNWQGDLAIDLLEVFSCVTCASPNSLVVNNITPNTADISWTPSGNETEWELHYNGSSIITNTIPTTLTNLTPSTNYTCSVSAVCSPTDTSSTSSAVVFLTGCSFSLAPLIETFDTVPAGDGIPLCWSQEQVNDDFDWELEAGGTPSAGTGPDDDISIGGNYMYTEASNPRQDGDFAIMYSEQVDLSNLPNAKIKFYTHMYGSAIGEIQIDMFDGGNYVPIFNKIGEVGDFWVEENVLITPSTNFVHFRITGILSQNANGDTWPGDIAIDQFSVVEAMADDLELLSGSANSGCDLSNSELVSIELVNSAANAQSNFDVSYTINGGSPVIETFTSSINPGDTVTYNFNTTADLSTDGVYNFEYECLLVGDQNTTNNISTNISENFISPVPPVTFDDTICLGDTAFLEATTNQGLINWYSDPNGNSAISTNAVTPNITTTYYAEVQASNFYKDDFESYPIGALIAQSSAFWTTLSGAGGGPFDAFISGAQMSSGNNSIYVNQLNDDDLYLLFNPLASEGIVEISMDLRIETSAHINLQDESLPASNEIFEIILSSGVLEFDIGPTVLTTSYPGNNTWFNLKLEGNLASSTWNLYIDGIFVLGSYIAGADQVGSVNFRPEVGDEYYIDDVEWYVIADDDCISGLSPLTVTVEDCSSIGENSIHDLDLYPNPTSGILNFNGTTLLEAIQVIDNHGKIVFENNINSFKGSLDLSHLSRGIYFIKGITNSGTIHKKIILN